LVFLEGSPLYYGKRGFADATKLGFRPPTLRYPPGAFQVAKLSSYEEWMTGTFIRGGSVTCGFGCGTAPHLVFYRW
jgi:putative acetyltransferase